MARYIVYVKETTRHRYEVEAESEEEALEKWPEGDYISWEYGLGDCEAVEVEKVEE